MSQRNWIAGAALAAAVACTPATAGMIDAVEFYNQSLDHYFTTSYPDEIFKLESGFFVGWQRTNLSFKVLDAVDTTPGAVAVCRYLGERDAINHVHFRNVIVRKPYVDYTEVFLDEGQVDMFAVMKELVRQKYPRTIYPEHPRAIDPDRDSGSIRKQYPGGGGFAGEVYNVGYARAMLQAALPR